MPRILLFRSVEDASMPPDPEICARAPFAPTLRLGASLYSWAPQADPEQKIGTATACARLTDPHFPPGLQQDFYVEFQLAEGTFAALGTCTLVSNDVPARGLVLAGCNLRLTRVPAWAAGGLATSASVFNPGNLPGFATGSYWTLLVYEAAEARAP